MVLEMNPFNEEHTWLNELNWRTSIEPTSGRSAGSRLKIDLPWKMKRHEYWIVNNKRSFWRSLARPIYLMSVLTIVHFQNHEIIEKKNGFLVYEIVAHHKNVQIEMKILSFLFDCRFTSLCEKWLQFSTGTYKYSLLLSLSAVNMPGIRMWWICFFPRCYQ